MKKIIMLLIILPCLLRAGLTELYIQSCMNKSEYKMLMSDIPLIDNFFFSLFTQFNLKQSFSSILEDRNLTEMVKKHAEAIVEILQQSQPADLFSSYIPSLKTFKNNEIYNSENTFSLSNISLPHVVEYNKKTNSLLVIENNQRILGCIKGIPTLPKMVKSAIPCPKERLYCILRSTFIVDEPIHVDIWSTTDEKIFQVIPINFVPTKTIHAYLGSTPILVFNHPDQENVIIFERQKIHLLKSVMLLIKLTSNKDPADYDVSQWDPDWSNEFIMLPEWAKKKFPEYFLKMELEPKKRSSPLTLRTPRKTSLSNFPASWMPIGRKAHSADIEN